MEKVCTASPWLDYSFSDHSKLSWCWKKMDLWPMSNIMAIAVSLWSLQFPHHHHLCPFWPSAALSCWGARSLRIALALGLLAIIWSIWTALRNIQKLQLVQNVAVWGIFRRSIIHSYNTTVLQDALASSELYAIHGAGFICRILHSTGSGNLQDCRSPIVSAYPTKTNRMGIFQVH